MICNDDHEFAFRSFLLADFSNDKKLLRYLYFTIQKNN